MSEELLPKELEEVLKNPVTSHALLSMIIEDGVKMNIDLSKLTHKDRSQIIRKIYHELGKREELQ